ncbi:hypothetical protein DL769_004228 [Monosporascus sp. CRB-8-3]|nr:hypothetical protein DL769_004228 [Monosporascus sp. CRB-8-3]
MDNPKAEGLGLSTLYTPKQNVAPLFDIVLVHGLNGHYINTWRADDGSVWPVHLLTRERREVRIMTFGYRGTYNDTTSLATIYDHGLSLLTQLIDARKESQEELRPIIFVGHSLGGIIIKQIFFSTPHNGIDAEKWETFVRGILKYMKPDKSNDPGLTAKIAKAIHYNSEELVQISQAFRVLQNIVYLVTKDSATMKVGHENIRMLSREHFDICRFSEEDMVGADFKQVLAAIKNILEDSPKAKLDFGDIGRKVIKSLRVEELRANPLVVMHTKDTCGWISNKPVFVAWQNSSSEKTNKLWIWGKPGCGKTYLAKHIVNLETRRGNMVAQCFLEEVPEDRNTSYAILLLLLHDVLIFYPELTSKFMVKEYSKRKTREDTWDIETIKGLWPEVISEATKMNRHLTLVVDGLDQCGVDPKEFFECFTECEKLVEKPGILKLLVVSRDCAAYQDHSNASAFATQEITDQDTIQDIKATVKESLESTVKRRRYSQGLTKLMHEKITEGADGMYLWARIMADEVKLATLSEGQLESELNTLPRGIIELYDKILGRIGQNKKERDLIKFVLFWTTFRHKVLKAEELRFGIAMSSITAIHGAMEINEKTLSKFLPQISIKHTVSCLCGHLIKFSADRVNLVHRSLKEFLTIPTREIYEAHPDILVRHHEGFFFETERSHKVIGDFCVAYLLLGCFAKSGEPFNSEDPGPQKWEEKVLDRIERHGFVRYAAQSWIAHIRLSGEPFSAHQNFDLYQSELLDLGNQKAICWTEVWWYYEKWRPTQQGYPGSNLSLDDVFADRSKSGSSSIPSIQRDSNAWNGQRRRPPPPPPPLPHRHNLKAGVFPWGTSLQPLGPGAGNVLPMPMAYGQNVRTSAQPPGSSGQQAWEPPLTTEQPASPQSYINKYGDSTPTPDAHPRRTLQERRNTKARDGGDSIRQNQQPGALPAGASPRSPNVGLRSGVRVAEARPSSAGEGGTGSSRHPGSLTHKEPYNMDDREVPDKVQRDLDDTWEKPTNKYTKISRIEKDGQPSSEAPIDVTSLNTGHGSMPGGFTPGHRTPDNDPGRSRTPKSAPTPQDAHPLSEQRRAGRMIANEPATTTSIRVEPIRRRRKCEI